MLILCMDENRKFEMGSYPTKRTPVHCLHFTLRNLLLCQDLSQPHHEGVNEGRSPRVLLTSFTRTQFSPLPLPLSRLSTQLKNSPPSMSMGQDYSCIILYLEILYKHKFCTLKIIYKLQRKYHFIHFFSFFSKKHWNLVKRWIFLFMDGSRRFLKS